jgi:hypothetical protein
MANEFLVSVANVVLRDPTTKNALMYGKANISSAFALSMQSADVRAGINNSLLYSYYHTRELTVNIEAATFGEGILALNAGSLASTGNVNVLQTECVQLSGGAGSVTLTPVGDVSVILPDGSIQTVTPSTKAITVSGGGDLAVDAIYTTSKSADQIVIGATTPPSIVDLTLIAEIRSADQSTVLKYLQVNIPQFQVAGNYTLNLTANGVSTQPLEGKALVSFASDCTTGDYYAKVSYIPVSSTTTYSSIAAIPSTINFSEASVPDTSAISVLGIRGGLYQNANITSDCTFSVASGGSASITVSAGGVVTAGSAAVDTDAAVIDVLYASGSITDRVTVLVGA